VIIGAPTEGVAAAFVDGTVIGSAPITVVSQWLLDGTLAGATFTPATGDAGKTLQIRRSASNAFGSGVTSTSNGVTIAAAEVVQLWSNPATWGGTMPLAGEDVTISAGKNVLLDVDPPSLGTLTIVGKLMPDPTKDVNLTIASIRVMSTGWFQAGTDDLNRHPKKFVVTYTGARPTVSGNAGGGAVVVGATHTGNTSTGNNGTTNDNNGAMRSLIIEDGGTVIMWGKLPGAVHRTFLNANAASGATALTVQDTTGWSVGDQIVVPATGFYRDTTRPEMRTLSANASGTGLSITAGLGFFRFGRMQYLTDASPGLSLTPGGAWGAMKDDAAMPDTLDERAEVANVTRGIVFQGANDTHWSTNRFGFHGMVMGLNSVAIIDGVEMRRCGQGGLLGRYPWHWHMLSYNPTTGAFLGAIPAGKGIMRNCSVWNSTNRGVSVHGTEGTLVKDNVFHDILGHVYILEDGSEQNNTADGNWFFDWRDPGNGWRLKSHDEFTIFSYGDVAAPSAMWISNLGNTIINNRGRGGKGTGAWHAIAEDRSGFPGGCFGPSSQVAVHPHFIRVQLIQNNTFQGCAATGALTDLKPYNEAGDLSGGNLKLHSTTDGQPEGQYVTTRQVHTNFKRYILGKNNGGGYGNRLSKPDYELWVCFDNIGTHLRGVTDPYNDSKARGLLAINRTLNNDTQPTTAPGGFTYPVTRNAFASYHSTLAFFTTIIGFGNNSSVPSQGDDGFIKMDSALQSQDFYFEPVETGQANTGTWKMIDTIGMYNTPPHHLMNDGWLTWGTPDSSRHWTFSGAKHDPKGNFGGNPGDYIVYDHPYCLYGLPSVPPLIAPTAVSKSRATPTHYYGVVQRGVDSYRDDNFAAPMTFQRLDTSNAAVAGAVWTIADARSDGSFQPMRHGVCPAGGRVYLTNPGFAVNATNICLEIRNHYRRTTSGDAADDIFYLTLDWSGSVPPKVHARWGNSSSGVAHQATSGQLADGSSWAYAVKTSKALLEASATAALWLDTSNNKLHLKHIAVRTAKPTIGQPDPPVTYQLGVTPA
jgi:hypothetical protein